MGDRCYMHLTCRRQDQSTFEALGFVLDFEQSPESPVIEMADEQANYAHCNALPTTVPFTAWHSAGSNYGDGRIACDGKRWGEVACDPEGGFVVDWDFKQHRPTAASVKRIRRYLAVHDRVQRRFKRLRPPSPP